MKAKTKKTATAKAKTKKKPTAKAKPHTKVKAKKAKVTKAKTKTKKKGEKTHIIAVIDKSSSMASIATAAISGFNEFLASQKKLKDPATMNVVLFSSYDRITPLYEDKILDVKDVQELTPLTYVPDGMTALNDAIVQSMTSYKLKMNTMKPSKRPEKVLVIIVTDGEENNSREYPKSKVDEVKGLITKRKAENWQFMFLCATEEAALTGESLGVSKGNTFQYTNDLKGNAVMFNAMSIATSSYRGASVKDKNFLSKTDNLLAEDDVIETKVDVDTDLV
jgi:hypothetical protein